MSDGRASDDDVAVFEADERTSLLVLDRLIGDVEDDLAAVRALPGEEREQVVADFEATVASLWATMARYRELPPDAFASIGGPPPVIEPTPVVLQAPEQVLAIVSRLTRTHEAAQARPWQVGDAPPDYIAKMLEAIVGIEIPVEQLAGKWKVSQNRARADRDGVAAGLAPHDPAMAALVAHHGGA